MLEVKAISASNLPDAARLCLAGNSLADRPRAFTRDVEMDCSRCKLSFLREKFSSGTKALAAYRAGMLTGYIEFHPVEEAPVPVRGIDCHVITCLRVPEQVERSDVEPALVEAALAAFPGTKGLAVLAREKDWSGLGFEVVERTAAESLGDERVLWFRRAAEGHAPSIIDVDRGIARVEGKVRVDIFTTDRCAWDKYVFDLVRGVIASMPQKLAVFETDCNNRREILRSGVGSAIAINGIYQQWFRPHRLPDEHTIRRALEDAV